jgi:hypothetical protein
MTSWLTGLLALGGVLGGTALGFLLRHVLPARLIGEETRDVVRQLISVIGTVCGIVLGLTLTGGRSAYERQREELVRFTSRVLALDRALAMAGPESRPSRAELKSLVEAAAERLWPPKGGAPGRTDPAHASEVWFHRLRARGASDEDGRFYKARAVELASELLETRWLVHQQASRTVLTPFVALVTLLFALTFGAIGLLAPRNALGVGLLLLCSGVVAGALFLAFEMDQPFSGVLRMSREPFDRVLERLGSDAAP